MSQQCSLHISEASQSAEVRRRCVETVHCAGFSETEAGKVALVVTEAATNLLKHAGEGHLLWRVLVSGGAVGFELLALDRGPGMANPSAALRDGYSTAGSPGTGLGAIQRLSTVFDLYSAPEKGTVLLTQVWTRGTKPEEALDIGAVCLPIAGETECGDAWAVKYATGSAWLLVADGLGHGPLAADAAQEAVRTFKETAVSSPAELLKEGHLALRATRGAAAAVAQLQHSGRLVFAGVGNISASLLTEDHVQHLVSHNGIVGHKARRFQDFPYLWPADALLVMHSDGLTAHWQLDGYPGLRYHHPALIAGVLYRDFQRGRDDATVVVARRRVGLA